MISQFNDANQGIWRILLKFLFVLLNNLCTFLCHHYGLFALSALPISYNMNLFVLFLPWPLESCII